MSDFAIAMPYWNASDALDRTVESLRRRYPVASLRPITVICDDGSDVPLEGAARRIVGRLPNKKGALNPCVPINLAVTMALRYTPIVVLTNPGTVFEEGMLESMRESLTTPMHYVIAACRDAQTKRWLCHSTVNGGEYGRLPMPKGSGFHFLVMFHEQLWNEAGGFDLEYRDGQACEDNDWLWRVENAGGKFVMRDDIVVENTRSTTAWPAGGLVRNREILERKWGHRWTAS